MKGGWRGGAAAVGAGAGAGGVGGGGGGGGGGSCVCEDCTQRLLLGACLSIGGSCEFSAAPELVHEKTARGEGAC